jgi:gliding motility-associated-like protein
MLRVFLSILFSSYSILSYTQCSFPYDLGANIDLCLSDSIQLNGPSAINYSWTPVNNISSTSIQSPWVSPTDTTTYYLTSTDLNGCIGTDSITINVNIFSGLLSINNNDTICSGNSINLIASGALNYSWTPAASLSNPSIPFPLASPTVTTTYYLTGYDANSCSSTDSVEIFVHSLPNVIAGNDTSICPGTFAQLNASGGVDYQWLVNNNLSNYLISNPIATPSDTIEYVVEVTDLNNCSAKDTIVVNVFKNAEANAGFNVSICANVAYQLEASGGVEYNWQPSNLLNHDTIYNPLAFPEDDMSFIVEITDSNGCIDSDTMQILIFKIHTDSDTILCYGDSVQVDVLGDPATIFDWQPYVGISDSSSYEPWLYPQQSTNYIVTATNSQGCQYTDTVIIDVPDPEPIMDTNLIAGCDGIYMNYINNSNTDLQFEWIFSDGSNSVELSLEKLFDFNSNFSAKLLVEDFYGCQDSITYYTTSLSFEDYYRLYSPNVFTPNNDGINDIFEFEVAGRMYECAEIVIYNKWGETQFSSSGNNINWDGHTSSGILASEGTYFYTITIKGEKEHGALQLFR